jgi:hypothetical protein
MKQYDFQRETFDARLFLENLFQHGWFDEPEPRSENKKAAFSFGNKFY